MQERLLVGGELPSLPRTDEPKHRSSIEIQSIQHSSSDSKLLSSGALSEREIQYAGGQSI